MIAHRLFVPGLAPTKSTYFRLLELAPLIVLAGLWKQGDLTWPNGAFAVLGIWALYKVAPWIIESQLPRLSAMHTRDCTRLEERIVRGENPAERQWLQQQMENMPQRGHLHLDPAATFGKYRQLARWLKKAAFWMLERLERF